MPPNCESRVSCRGNLAASISTFNLLTCRGAGLVFGAAFADLVGLAGAVPVQVTSGVLLAKPNTVRVSAILASDSDRSDP